MHKKNELSDWFGFGGNLERTVGGVVPHGPVVESSAHWAGLWEGDYTCGMRLGNPGATASADIATAPSPEKKVTALKL